MGMLKLSLALHLLGCAVLVGAVRANVLTLEADPSCACEKAPCPDAGETTLTLGGGAKVTYSYAMQNGFPVVISAKGTIYPASLDKGTASSTCTTKYARILEDDDVWKLKKLLSMRPRRLAATCITSISMAVAKNSLEIMGRTAQAVRLLLAEMRW
ncbi:hypothetical protein CYMTET_27737 [Cymbomonas tetramitiformis]|uniref:Uncharacterized protein n=1 Tax=Cymbomonas tetramitiformis TaxID=36881 RepID=A0AAE0FPT4_9CHLO|nr:hypothetical protein CYMTET_27737 [Cymbomonas tetramitiformis]